MRQADITIPYAIADFAILREYGYYYVDKTRYISLLERYSAPVFLRPRRFGKSLFISTLAYYYDLNEAGRFDSLFGSTYIGSHPTGEQNKYMVLRLDFSKMVVADNLKELESNFTNQLLTAFNDPLYEEVTTGESFLRTFFKVIKSGIGEGSIRSCFCTGVLPVTMDDLTSGYNIAEILTLKPEFVSMLGFTHEETAAYLHYVLQKYDKQGSTFEEKL